MLSRGLVWADWSGSCICTSTRRANFSSCRRVYYVEYQPGDLCLKSTTLSNFYVYDMVMDTAKEVVLVVKHNNWKCTSATIIQQIQLRNTARKDEKCKDI